MIVCIDSVEMLAGQLSWLSHMKMCFSHEIKAVGHMTFFRWPTCQPDSLNVFDSIQFLISTKSYV